MEIENILFTLLMASFFFMIREIYILIGIWHGLKKILRTKEIESEEIIILQSYAIETLVLTFLIVGILLATALLPHEGVM